MVRPKHLVTAAVTILAAMSFAVSAQAHHRRGYSSFGHPNPHRAAYRYSFTPTYYPGPPWYPGPAFYGPLRYGSYYGDYYYRPRRAYHPY